MVQYSEAIYNIIRKKIKDIEDVNNYKTISETLLSTNTNFDQKVNQLYTYLKNEGVNISKIKTLIPNQELLSALNKCYKNIDNININNINQQIIKQVTKYYRENTDINNDNIDIDKLTYFTDDSKDISDDEYNNIINSLNILKNQKTIYNILTFIFTCGFNNLYKSQLNDDYSEFNIIDRWYKELINPKNIENINKDDIINIYKSLGNHLNLKGLYDDLVKLKNYTNTNIELNYNKNIENDKNITSVFINSKWTVDKNDNILKPSIKTVNNFLMFFDNDDNVNKITSNDIFNSWNIQLMNIYNNVINMQNYIQFFIRLKDLKDDKELQKFCIDQTGFNDNQIVIEKNNNILHKFKTSKIKDDDKKTVEEFINEIIDNYNKGVVITEQDYMDDVQLLKDILNSINKESEDPNQIIQFVKETINTNEVYIINKNKKIDTKSYGEVYRLLSEEQVVLSGHNKNKSGKIIDNETIGEHIITELQTVLNEKFKRDNIKIKNENNSFFKSFDNLISNDDNKIMSFFTQFENIDGIKKEDLYDGILKYFSNQDIYKFLSTFYCLMFTMNKFN